MARFIGLTPTLEHSEVDAQARSIRQREQSVYNRWPRRRGETPETVQAQIKLGRIAGIAVGLHYSWFIIALLITLSLADHFHSVTSPWGSGVVWASAIITGLCFFAALLMHELAHSLVAQAHGMRVQAITLFALGGVSQIESDAASLIACTKPSPLFGAACPLARCDFSTDCPFDQSRRCCSFIEFPIPYDQWNLRCPFPMAC